MKKIKILMLFVGLVLFSFELFAEDNVTDSVEANLSVNEKNIDNLLHKWDKKENWMSRVQKMLAKLKEKKDELSRAEAKIAAGEEKIAAGKAFIEKAKKVIAWM